MVFHFPGYLGPTHPFCSLILPLNNRVTPANRKVRLGPPYCRLNGVNAGFAALTPAVFVFEETCWPCRAPWLWGQLQQERVLSERVGTGSWQGLDGPKLSTRPCSLNAAQETGHRKEEMGKSRHWGGSGQSEQGVLPRTPPPRVTLGELKDTHIPGR